jgi:hypothetical protein
MSAPVQPVPWDQLPFECFLYFLCVGFLLFPSVLLGSLVIAVLPRQPSGVLTRRIARFGQFCSLFLAIISLFNGFWILLVFNRLYYSTDDFASYLPCWPITWHTLDQPFGNERGLRPGVVLWQLQLVWWLFVLGIWTTTLLFYKWLDRLINRAKGRRTRIAFLFALGLFPASLLLMTLAWCLGAPHLICHDAEGVWNSLDFFPPFLGPPTDAGHAAGRLRNYFTRPEWEVYGLWHGVLAAGVCMPGFVWWRLRRDQTETGA